MRPSGGYLLVVVEDLEQTPEGRAIRDRHDTGPMATDREINCPSAGKSVSAYRETDMAASNTVVSGVLATGDGEKPLSSIQEPFEARVVTRAIRGRLDMHDGIRTYAGVTLGGGNAILMAFRQIPGEDEGDWCT